jgi:hypothetical protein
MPAKRVTITVPEDVARRLEEIDNVSAYFTAAARALDRKLRTEALVERAVGDADPEVRAKVRANLQRQMAAHDAARAARALDKAQKAKEQADSRLAALERSRKKAA